MTTKRDGQDVANTNSTDEDPEAEVPEWSKGYSAGWKDRDEEVKRLRDRMLKMGTLLHEGWLAGCFAGDLKAAVDSVLWPPAEQKESQE